MKKIIWISMFIFTIAIVNAQINLELDGDASPGSEVLVKVTIDDPSLLNLKTYDNSNLKIEVVGPAKFKDGEKIKTQDPGRITKKTKIFEEYIKINKGHSEDKGSVEVIAKFDYNLRKFQMLGGFKWVVEESKTKKEDTETLEIEGFEVVEDIGDYESLLYENEQLEGKINDLENELLAKEADVSSKDSEISSLTTELSLCNENRTKQEETISSLENKCKIKTIEPFIFVGLIIIIIVLSIVLSILLFKKGKKGVHTTRSVHHRRQ